MDTRDGLCAGVFAADGNITRHKSGYHFSLLNYVIRISFIKSEKV